MDMEGVGASCCVVLSVSYTRIMDSPWLTGWSHQVLIHLFTMDFLQLSQETTVSVRKPSTDSGRRSKRPGHNHEKNSFSVSAQECAKMVIEVAADWDDFFPRWNDYNVSRKILDLKLLEQDVSTKVIMTSVKQLRKKLRCQKMGRGDQRRPVNT